jgi:uroporphyrin-III C-methyltransferase
MTRWEALKSLREDAPILSPGHVWLAGAGPGDPGLLTLDALAGLLQADVIVHDALVDARVLALAPAGARLEFAGKRGGRPSVTQADISQRLIELARAEQRVLRLKGGDPYMFGRAGEEILALASAGVPFRVISGVTAGLAALAAAGIPATMRGINRSIIFTTGQSSDARDGQDWEALARTGQPIVIYMALHNLRSIAEALVRGGLAAETPAALIVAATRCEQEVLVSTLDRIAADAHAQNLEPPAIAVVGEIVTQRQRLRAMLDLVASESAP